MVSRLFARLILLIALTVTAIGIAHAGTDNGKGNNGQNNGNGNNGQNNGNGNGKGANPSVPEVPEIDPALLGGGIALLASGVLLVTERRRNQE